MVRYTIDEPNEQPADTRTFWSAANEDKREFGLSREEPYYRPDPALAGDPLPSGPPGGSKAQEARNRNARDYKEKRKKGVSAPRQMHDERPSQYDGKPLPGWRFRAEFKDYKFGCAEKLRFLPAAQRFRRIVTGSDTIAVDTDATELMDIFSLIDLAKLRADLMLNPFDKSPFKGIDLASLDHGNRHDQDLEPDGYGEAASAGQNSPVQYGGWQVGRDLETHARRLQNQDVLRLMMRELGPDFEILVKCICLDWSRRDLGRSETSYTDRAVCAGVATALVLSALRRLLACFARLDHLESGERPLRECRQLAAWYYVGKKSLPRPLTRLPRPTHINEAAVTAGLAERARRRPPS